MRKLHLSYDTEPCGTLSENPEGYVFLYDSTYLSLSDPQPVSQTLPLRPEPYIDHNLMSFFDGIIPEGWMLKLTSDNWKLNPNDRMGILSVACADPIGAVHIPSKLIQGSIPDALILGDTELDTLLDQGLTLIQHESTITGIQRKISAQLDSNYPKKITLVPTQGTHIVKLPSPHYPNLPENEFVTMQLASLCEIPTVPHTIQPLRDDQMIYITNRIDRGENHTRYHMEDMCQLSGRLTNNKYQGSYEQIAKFITKYSGLPGLDLVRFFELLVFCFVTGNADMHFKNFSLILRDNIWSLAPAYDLLNTAIANPNDTEQTALTLNGKKDKLTYQDFLSSAQTMGISQKVASTSILNILVSLSDDNRVDEILTNLNAGMAKEYKKILTQRCQILRYHT